MSNGLKQRIKTLQVLVKGSAALGANHAACNLLIAEFDEVKGAVRLSANRRYLLQVLHSTRALDGALKAFNTHHAILRPKSYSLGAYLYDLHLHNNAGLGTLPKTRLDHFYNRIARERNRYMHQPGQYPSDKQEIMTLLAEMDSCLTEVLNL